MAGQNIDTRDLFAEEILEGTDPGIKIDSMVLKSSRGLKERLKGPFTHEEAKAKVQEFRERTKSGIMSVEMSFTE